MWRVVYEQNPRGGQYQAPGPWFGSKAEAEQWLKFFLAYYPTAHLQELKGDRIQIGNGLPATPQEPGSKGELGVEGG